MYIIIRLFVLQHYVTIQDKPIKQKDPFISDNCYVQDL